MLLDAGNPLAAVSQWIGHATTEITNHYWERGPAQLLARLDVPWLRLRMPTLPSAPEAAVEDDEQSILAAFKRVLDENRRLQQELLQRQPLDTVVAPGSA